MCPNLAGLPTYGMLYIAGIALHLALRILLAHWLLVERRVWVTVFVCYSLSMLVGAKALYDLRAGDLRLAPLAQPSHYAGGGL